MPNATAPTSCRPTRWSSDADTVLLDHLIGGTVLENHGFVWVP